jgi:thiosulfate dehydrogenase
MRKTMAALLTALALTGCQPAPPELNGTSPTPETSPTGQAGSPDLALEGRRLFERTYEKMPGVKGKLHCASCHLQGGTTEGAVPLVNIDSLYPEQTALVGRVNGCLKNNLNGPTLTEESAEMKALLAYLQSLKAEPAPKRGLKVVAVPPQDASPQRGQALYATQCAACHQADGSGTYPDGKFEYPALWGEHSFTAAGDLSSKSAFAAFIFVKMPLGQGLTLKEQDVWDIAAYVIAQERPEPSP